LNPRAAACLNWLCRPALIAMLPSWSILPGPRDKGKHPKTQFAFFEPSFGRGHLIVYKTDPGPASLVFFCFFFIGGTGGFFSVGLDLAGRPGFVPLNLRSS